MQSLTDLSKIETRNLLVCVLDIENFVQLAKSFKKSNRAENLFVLLDKLAQITSQNVAQAGGVVIKYIGDSALIVFSEENVDSAVNALYDLKGELESFIETKGFHNKISLSLHFGETAIGYLGKEPYRWLDVIGDTVQLAFSMNGKPFKGRFTITPQVFRKLKSETRKIFHKFTPQIVYIAE